MGPGTSLPKIKDEFVGEDDLDIYEPHMREVECHC